MTDETKDSVKPAPVAKSPRLCFYAVAVPDSFELEGMKLEEITALTCTFRSTVDLKVADLPLLHSDQELWFTAHFGPDAYNKLVQTVKSGKVFDVGIEASWDVWRERASLKRHLLCISAGCDPSDDYAHSLAVFQCVVDRVYERCLTGIVHGYTMTQTARVANSLDNVVALLQSKAKPVKESKKQLVRPMPSQPIMKS